MPLMLPNFHTGLIQTNMVDNPGALNNGWGNTVTSNTTTANAKGAWTEIIASTDYHTHGLTLMCAWTITSNAQPNSLWDIGVGGAGSEQPIAENILIDVNYNLTGGTGQYIFLPLFIPSGSRVSCRMQAENGTSRVGRVLMFLHGGFDNPPWKSFAGVEGIGADTSTSSGTTIAAANTAGTESAWTNIGSATSKNYSALQLAIGSGGSIISNTGIYHVEVGWSSTTIAETVFISLNSENFGATFPFIPHYVTVPSGTQIQARHESNLATGVDIDIVALGYY